MEPGISGRNATLTGEAERYCKSCQTITFHLRFEELGIIFTVCMPCVALYLRNAEYEQLQPLIRIMLNRRV